ncbi:MAG: molybdate ABC transporter substrate-binding protein [Pseudomonadota bacterium]
MGSIAFLLLSALATTKSGAEQITVFAAASTADALQAVTAQFEEEQAIEVSTVFAASSTLAKQIAQGAPADIFLSANRQWIDHLAGLSLLHESLIWDRLSNELVLITHAETEVSLAGARPQQDLQKITALLEQASGEARLVVGDPSHVPAGIYAKALATRLGLWERLQPHLAFASDVRRALTMVERREAPFGLVYRSDAMISPDVKTMVAFPKNLTGSITYAAAVIANRDRPAVQDFFAFLSGPVARQIFLDHGFQFLGGEG